MKSVLWFLAAVLVIADHTASLAQQRRCTPEEIEQDRLWNTSMCGRSRTVAAALSSPEKLAISNFLSELGTTYRLWRKGSLNTSVAMPILIKNITGLPAIATEGPLKAAKVTCAAAGQSLHNAMLSEQSRDRASSPSEVARWSRSVDADQKEYVRYETECRQFLNRAK